MSASDTDEDALNLPSREECEDRCNKFASITGTDTALAMFYLQDREWNLEISLNAYFSDNAGAQDMSCTEPSQKSEEIENRSKESDPEPHRIRLLSWNIDGLDTGNYGARTIAMCNTINKEKPHVVFLQEVIPRTITLLEDNCPLYQVIAAGNTDYFTVILLRVGFTDYEDHNITPFYTSKMMRNILSVKCCIKGISMLLMTSHLESTKAHGAERKRQLTTAMGKMKEAQPKRTVIFGGDLNLRDKEIQEIGGVPEGIFDLWEITGKRPDAKFTWDTQKNDNTEMAGTFKPRCRFDRLYLRHCKPSSLVKPVYFELVGLERLPCLRFSSDHWGLLTHFDIKSVDRPK